MASDEFAPGTMLAGKYRVEKLLGEGGMGVVLSAWHEGLQERVAIKLLRKVALQQKSSLDRFLREARAAAKLKTQHVVRVFDVGALEDGMPYIVMEHLSGDVLEDLITKRGALPHQEALGYVLEACEAIAEAHSLGIIHRDLKPANIFVVRSRDGSSTVKVLDFGISKVQSLGETTGTVLGTPLYMAPEQFIGKSSLDYRADIWALGVILYEILTGAVPFNAASWPELAYKVSSEAPPPITAAIPEELKAAILRALEKAPENRFLNVAELARAIAPFAAAESQGSIDRICKFLDVPIPAAPVSSSAIAITGPLRRTDDVSMSGPLPAPVASSPLKTILSMVAVLAVLGIGAFVARPYLIKPAASPPAPLVAAPAPAPTPTPTPTPTPEPKPMETAPVVTAEPTPSAAAPKAAALPAKHRTAAPTPSASAAPPAAQPTASSDPWSR